MSRTNERTEPRHDVPEKKTAVHLEDQETRRTLLLRETRKHERNERDGNVRSATKRSVNRDERFQSKRSPGDSADVTERTLSYGLTKTLQSTWENTFVHGTHDPHFCFCSNLWSAKNSILLPTQRDPPCRPMPR
mmetsp:Transcript_8264/g.51489  ORF Transcript_8264/g.51489 Transcript_8264/m.51489 type:complete len:134 (+) Transcript_8264:521-922(+)